MNSTILFTKMTLIWNALMLILISSSVAQIVIPENFIFKPGPFLPATKGYIWPRPQQEHKTRQFFVVNPHLFGFRILRSDCGILRRTLARYLNILRRTAIVRPEYLKYAPRISYNADRNYIGNLFLVDITLNGYCDDNEYPQIDMDEEYTLNITRISRGISSKSIWGIQRGLESLSQLIYLADDLRTILSTNQMLMNIKVSKIDSLLIIEESNPDILMNIKLLINVTDIHDFPRFPYRGLLLDTSRHYIPHEKILNVLDAMSYNKFNVFHWHIVDDYSFPYVSRVFPELSAKGAYHPALVYPQAFVNGVLRYARDRGIRVVVEFDTPGHTQSWGLGNPELLTTCYRNDGLPTGGKGPINPSRESNFVFLDRLFQEVTEVFHDRYIHLGGDEVDFTCWRSNPEINQFMADLGISGDYEALQSYYSQRLIDLIESKNRSSIVFQEVYVNGVNIPPSTVVEVWKPENWRDVVANITAQGHEVILSACWYLDILATGGDWLKFYACEPLDFEGTPAQKARVMGGEACMWTEVVNEYNIESRIWPRASAVIERLWSAPVKNLTSELILFDVGPRLEEHTCRMNRRGVGAQPPSAPNFCLGFTDV